MDKNKYAIVENEQMLVRDLNSKAILNKDDGGLNKYREDRENKVKMAKMMQEHNQIKNDVTEIKQLLKEILGKV
jgi:hypothetical protein